METRNNQSGFALLITIIVVGVIISIGLAMLDLSIKQVQLSSNAKESEKAFHAANAGSECARYWRREENDAMITGQSIDPDCFESSPDSNSMDEITDGVSGDGSVYHYEYEFTWGSNVRCSQVDTLVAVADIPGSGVTTTNATMKGIMPGYSSDDDHYCEAGSQCTTISVRGYNQPCGIVGGYGVVQREVLLQF